MVKLTKSKAKRRLNEILAKAKKLYMAGYISMKDMEGIERIVKTRSKQC